MFSSLRQRLILGIYIFIILSIPLGAYFLSESSTAPTSDVESTPAIENKPITSSPSPSPTSRPTSILTSPTDLLEELTLDESSDEPGATPTTATSFGPTLSFKVKLEGRPENNQSSRMFIGIAEGTIGTNPTFVLSFTVDIPSSGEFSNISLAGLTSGTTYSALLKGPSQIATSSAFVMTPTVSTLNNGDAILLLNGDLNEDNVVNSADYSIGQTALGSTEGSGNWNENVDFNRDGIINILDIGYIIKNFGKSGDSGAWTSPLPTPSTSPTGGVNDATPSAAGGYWIWVPQ